MSITSEKVLRKMNEIQSKGGTSIGHWHSLRKWLLEADQVQETFQEAVINDADMTTEQKEFWLSKAPLSAAESLTECPEGHGPLYRDGGLLFCLICKHTVSKEE